MSALGEGQYLDTPRMSLRDYFAGQAINGLLAAESPEVIYDAAGVAGRAYRIADAMLAAREAKP